LTVSVAASVKEVVGLAAGNVVQFRVDRRNTAVVKVVPRLCERIHRVRSVVSEACTAEVVGHSEAVVNERNLLLLGFGEHKG